jgi:hypothetical protein
MYYMLACLDSLDYDRASLDYEKDDPARSWHSGTRFTQPPPQPIEVVVDEDFPGLIPEFTDVPLPLMTRRLVKALHEAGVDNLDTYKVVISDPTTGQKHQDHVAVNIIGKIAAADLRKSVYDASLPERMISMDFDSVVIDEKKTRGAFLFRLAESVNAIVIHEKVKEHLEASGIDTLTFIPPEEWMG